MRKTIKEARALFLHTLGQEGLIVYNGMQLEENNTVGIIFDAFDNHFIGKTNETYERYVFNKRDQKNENQPKITLRPFILLLPHTAVVTV